MPLSLLPESLPSHLLTASLNRLLAAQLQRGELDFLSGRSLAIRVHDAYLSCRITLRARRLTVIAAAQAPDLTVAANLFDFMVLMARREDPDTLVFQRRLLMEGDTELGLELKNFLDGLDGDSLAVYGLLETALARVLPLYQRLFS